MSPPRPRTVSNLAKFSGSKETPRTHSTLSRAPHHHSPFLPPLAHFSLLLGFSRRPSANFILPRTTILSLLLLPPSPHTKRAEHLSARATPRARRPPYSLSRTPTRVYISPSPPLLLSAPSSLSLTEHLRHNTTMWPCVDTTTIQRRYRRERPLVALHRANDTKGITLLVPFGIQKKRCLTRYPNIYPPNPSIFFACSSHAFPARRNSFAHFLVPIQIHGYRLVIISNGSRVT